MTKPIRSVALVAHVDHGKTTLIDAMLRATHVFRENAALVDRVMDSNDQERERGITILAKAASIEWAGTRINLVDTPGHADFGGEVERSLALVDGVVLLVDAAEGPLPQTRYVLSKSLAAGLPTVVVLNKVDRHDARTDEVLHEVEELFLDLDPRDDLLEFPIVSAIAREGRSMVGVGVPGDGDDLSALLDTIVAHIPEPTCDPDAPLQAMVTNLDASDYLGRLAVGRVVRGTLRRGATVALLDEETAEGQTPVRRKLSQLLGFEGIERVEVDERRAGDLFVIAGFPEVEIGDTLADPEVPEALPRLSVDDPVLRMQFAVNTSPLAGQDGKYLTSRHLRDRLEREVLGNVSIRLEPTDSPDVIEVAGRGELQLAVLIESMRREGYELQVSRPEVIVKELNGKRHEPLERVVVDVPDDHVGTVTQAIAPRKGTIIDVRPGDSGRSILTFEAPARGLIGFRSLLLTATRGTALMHQHHGGWVPWAGELPHRQGGAMLADRTGSTTGYALDNLQSRGEFFLGPGEDVYEGMVVGENARPDDMNVNVVREKQKTNIRTHSHDDGIKLTSPRVLTLETAIEWIAEDELVEVTPSSLRVRKRVLKEQDRRRLTKK
ncbi:MAG: translational GTPase TypA [Acidimicrobiales bacterium]